jgi:predicted DNA-binding protein
MSRPKIVFTLDEEIIAELNLISKELKQKKSHIVEKALTLYFDLLDVKIADKRMKDIKEGKSKLIPAEEVYKDLGL